MTDKSREALARSNLYKLFSYVFLWEPDAEFLEGIRKALGVVGIDLDGHLDGEDVVEELAVEYAAVFVGPFTHLAPYESAFLEGRLMGDASVEVSRFYKRCGYGRAHSSRALPDHVGVELELMHHLAKREAECWQRGDVDTANRFRSLQREFLFKHLLGWVPDFCRKVEETASHPFYVYMARLTREFLRVEERELK
jgi:TorA maturation chaperone TorD